MDQSSLARDYLLENKKRIVLLKDGQVIYESDQAGLKALYDLFKDHREDLKEASVADTVVGQAAARLYLEAGIKDLYAGLISQRAKDLFEGAQIPLQFDRQVPHILNRDGSDLCPMEKISQASLSLPELVDNLGGFFTKISAPNKKEDEK